MEKGAKAKILQFADDTAIVVLAKTWSETERNMENSLARFDTYCKQNRLSINH